MQWVFTGVGPILLVLAVLLAQRSETQDTISFIAIGVGFAGAAALCILAGALVEAARVASLTTRSGLQALLFAVGVLLLFIGPTIVLQASRPVSASTGI